MDAQTRSRRCDVTGTAAAVVVYWMTYTHRVDPSGRRRRRCMRRGPVDRKPNAVERYTVDWETTCVMSACLPACVQEAELLMTNPRDAFRGQSKSPNIVPFHMLGILFLLCNSNFVFKTRRFSDIRLQKMSWPWNPGQRSLKVIESGTIR